MSTKSKSAQIDPRGPRVGAAITGVLLVLVVALSLPTARTPEFDAGFWLLVLVAISFAWGSLWGPARHPYAWLFRTLIRPRLSPPEFMEDQAPPRFAQTVGLVTTLVGLVLHLWAVPYGLVIAAAIAFVAAFLNAVFGLCLGCEMYSLLLRLRKPSGASR